MDSAAEWLSKGAGFMDSPELTWRAQMHVGFWISLFMGRQSISDSHARARDSAAFSRAMEQLEGFDPKDQDNPR